MTRSASMVRFTNYSHNHHQATNVGDIDSDMKPVICGVPLDSIFGPLIFILCMNSLPSAISNALTYLYADDVAIVAQGSDLELISATLTNDLESVNTWLQDHKLSIHTEKTKMVYFGTSNKSLHLETPPVILNDTEIERVTTYKYLGLMLYLRLRFDAHADYSVTKL